MIYCTLNRNMTGAGAPQSQSFDMVGTCMRLITLPILEQHLGSECPSHVWTVYFAIQFFGQ